MVPLMVVPVVVMVVAVVVVLLVLAARGVAIQRTTTKPIVPQSVTPPVLVVTRALLDALAQPAGGRDLSGRMRWSAGAARVFEWRLRARTQYA